MKVDEIRKDLKKLEEEQLVVEAKYQTKYREISHRKLMPDCLSVEVKTDFLIVEGWTQYRDCSRGVIKLSNDGAIFIRDWLCELYGLPKAKELKNE